jgi:hypothetical protein
MRYVKGVLDGKHKNDTLFGTLLQAIVLKQDKETRGASTQAFKFAPELIELAHIIFTHSPRAYESLRDHLPLPTSRTLLCVFIFFNPP